MGNVAGMNTNINTKMPPLLELFKKMPPLYKVVYDRTPLYTDRDIQINMWLNENCRLPYYHSPGYLHEKFIEFEDEKEAMWFALRWC